MDTNPTGNKIITVAIATNSFSGIVSLLCRNMGIRDVAKHYRIAQRCVLNTLKKHGKQTITPKKKQYHAVHIDELWSFVGTKKNKHWLLYAYAPETKEVLAYVCGSCTQPTVRKLYDKLRGIDINHFDTDHWSAFKGVFPEDKHRIGKTRIQHIEGANTSLRARNRRFVCKKICFSKSYESHHCAISLLFAYRNRHHTL